MKRDILVALYSEDTYVLNWMSLLVVRDWRTRVVTEATTRNELFQSLSQENFNVDLMVIDVDSVSDLKQIALDVESYRQLSADNLKVIALCEKPNPDFFRYFPPESIAGVLFKQEIMMSLGWAITFSAEDKQVFTPKGIECSWNSNFPIEDDRLVLYARKYPGLTERQSEIARLAIIFSIGRRDLADELKISDQWSYGVVSELYDHLGLSELLDESEQFNSILENDKVIKGHIDEILEDLGTSKKARDLETLAFHLLTMPVIE